MKKSLIVRWAVIALVILVWTIAMFPLKDKDFLTTFNKVAAKGVDKVKTEAKAYTDAFGIPTELKKAADAISDKESQAYKDAAKKLETAMEADGYKTWLKSRDYAELEARLALIKHKTQYENAEYLKKQMAATNKDLPDYKNFEDQLNAIVNAKDYADWTKTQEYAELLRRLPAAQLKKDMDLMPDSTTDAYKKMAAQLKELQDKLDVTPAFEKDGDKEAYETIVKHLTLVGDVDKSISGFKMLELAANGNSENYRIALSDFIHIPFHGVSSNKMILRYIRVKSAGKLHLGLDLRGGTEFILDFDIKEAQGLMVTDKVLQEYAASYFAGSAKGVDSIPQELKAKLDAYKATAPKDAADAARAFVGSSEIAAELRAFLADNTKLIKRGADNFGTVTDIRDRILNILDNRLNSMGVTEPEIKANGDNSISVRMPSVDEADKNEIRNTIRRAAKLEFFLVAQNDRDLVQEYEKDRQAFKTPAGLIRTEIENERSNGTITYTPVFLEGTPTPVKGGDIERAFATSDELGRWVISLKFNANGTIAFRDVTSKNVGRQLAIVLDGKVYSAPVLRTEIGNGQAVIEGTFTLEEAKRLASVIASGNVPVTVNIGSEFGTDPTLGRDSVKSGLVAALLGLAVVILFMLYYYRAAGFVAVCALVVNTLLVLGTMAITKATITMPGIAGMILTIGMAVDANVIIFERIREEIAAKATVANAVTAGYSKAFTAIFDSNLTTLLTCFFLYRFGTGSIKGFAVTLSFGILASMFTAIFMTRAIFDFLCHKDIVKTLTMTSYNWLQNMHVDFMAHRKPAVIASVILVVICLGAFIVRGNKMMGIDFTGGTEMSYECQGQRPDVEKIRAYLQSEGYSDNIRVGYKRGQSNEYLLEIVLPAVRVNGMEKAVDYTSFNEKLNKAFPEVKINVKQTNAVGANVGSQFRKAAWAAALLSICGIIIYLAFRFEFMYGVAATVAIIHDAIASAGLFVICGGHISLTVIAAIMTIMGYSLNDTIVIFDRIRETAEERKDLTYTQLINTSLNECMSRTLMTSLTTMLVVIALLVLGGGAVWDFALVMFFGIITGTYSSIFVASAIINTWHKRTAQSARAEAKALKQANKEAKEAKEAAKA